VAGALAGRVVAEQLVFDAYDAPALGGQVATSGQAHGMAPGGPVERLGDGSPPVDHQRLLVLAGDGQAADVEGLAVGPVDPSEAQGLTSQLQLLEAVEGVAHYHVPLGDGLRRAAPLPQRRLQAGAGPGAQGLQPLVGSVEVRLLGLELRM
jgi:hypothetical protein